MTGYVVVLQNQEAGVTVFPDAPDSEGLTALMRSQVEGRQVEDPPKYMRGGESSVLGFTADLKQARVFASQGEAQAAINQIPSVVRPTGLSVRALND